MWVKSVGNIEGYVRHRVGQIDKERVVLVSFNEIYGVESELPCEFCLVARGYCRIYNALIFEEGQVGIRTCWMQRPHIIGVRDTVKFIKSVVGGEKLSLYPQVPFAVNCSGISFLFKKFCNSLFIG